ncbi:PREDICTED: olfactory receptor 4D1-like [Gekko japonicus]|uniref:Olfactory receptor 4D1-like n=1 Tax=Gekko japonicus TaxID=146911 RepID=A0ABM1JKE4_GEKJA|nr:PREDICTED: olfactory receptor 4D1-like [Gekko japonicus]
MAQDNQTSGVTEFILLGLSQNSKVNLFLFLLFLIIYITTWIGNLTIILTVIFMQQLHTPMYFLLANLAGTDIVDSTVTVLKMLGGLLSQPNTISFNWCIAQIFFFHCISAAVDFFLVLLAVDRYIAIYKPLQYLLIMKREVCIGFVAAAWMSGFIHSIVQIGILVQLPFCGPNTLDHFFCDISQFVRLSCTDTYMTEILMVTNSGLLLVVIFFALLVSYSVILIKIRTHVMEGRHKALSTCAAQLMVVSIHFGPAMFTYNQLFKVFPTEKFVALMYTLITPMLNPLIYTLRNAEMKNAIRKLKRKILSSRRNSCPCGPDFSSEYLKCRRCI